MAQAIPIVGPQQRQLGNVSLPTFQAPAVPPAVDIGGALTSVADIFKKVQDGADAAEATRIATVHKAESEGLLQTNKAEIADPGEFLQKSTDGLAEIQKKAIESASNTRVRAHVQNLIADDLVRNKTALTIDHRAKIKDKAVGDADSALEMLAQSAIKNTSEENQKQVGHMAGQLVGSMKAAGYYKPKEAEDILQKFDKKVNSERMNLEARQQPEDFITKVQSGAFDGKRVDATDVQRALDIAIKVSDLKARRDAKVGHELSQAAERDYEIQAEQHKMDIDQMRATARMYGWSKEKVDGLTNIQIGIKAASPYEKQMIDDAMAPSYTNAIYTSNNILKAEQNLRKLAKDRNISTLTPEYREAITRLQSMTDRLRTQGDIKDRTSEFDARQSIHDLYNQYMPGQRSPQATAEIAGHMRRIDSLAPNERRAYVEKTEKALKDNFEKNKTPQVQINKLLGALGPEKK